MQKESFPTYDYSYIKSSFPDFYREYESVISSFHTGNYIAAINTLVPLYERGYKLFFHIQDNEKITLFQLLYYNPDNLRKAEKSIFLDYDLLLKLCEINKEQKHYIKQKELLDDLDKKKIVSQFFSFFTQLYRWKTGEDISGPSDEYIVFISSFDELKTNRIKEIDDYKADRLNALDKEIEIKQVQIEDLDKETARKKTEQQNLESVIDKSKATVEEIQLDIDIAKEEREAEEKKLLDIKSKRQKEEIKFSIKTGINYNEKYVEKLAELIVNNNFDDAKYLIEHTQNYLLDYYSYIGLIYCHYKAHNEDEVVLKATEDQNSLKNTEIYLNSQKFLDDFEKDEIKKIANRIDDSISLSKINYYLKNNMFENAQMELNALEQRTSDLDLSNIKKTLQNEPIYLEGKKAYEEKKFEKAIGLFESISSYKYAQDYIDYSYLEIEKIEQQRKKEEERRIALEKAAAEEKYKADLYQQAKDYIANNEYQKAIENLELIHPYKLSRSLIEKSKINMVLSGDKSIIDDTVFEKIREMALDCIDRKYYEKAISILEKIVTYEDASVLIDNCKLKIQLIEERKKKNEALRLKQAELRREKEERKKEELKRIHREKEINEGLKILKNHDYANAKDYFIQINHQPGVELVEEVLKMQPHFFDYMDGTISLSEYKNLEKKYSYHTYFITFINNKYAINHYNKYLINKLLSTFTFPDFINAYDIYLKLLDKNEDNIKDDLENDLTTILTRDGLLQDYLREVCIHSDNSFLKKMLINIFNNNEIIIPLETCYYIRDQWPKSVGDISIFNDDFDYLKDEADSLIKIEEERLKEEAIKRIEELKVECNNSFSKGAYERVVEIYEEIQSQTLFKQYLISLLFLKKTEQLKQYNIFCHYEYSNIFADFITSKQFRSYTNKEQNDYIRYLISVYKNTVYYKSVGRVLLFASTYKHDKTIKISSGSEDFKKAIYRLVEALDFLYPEVFDTDNLSNLNLFKHDSITSSSFGQSKYNLKNLYKKGNKSKALTILEIIGIFVLPLFLGLGIYMIITGYYYDSEDNIGAAVPLILFGIPICLMGLYGIFIWITEIRDLMNNGGKISFSESIKKAKEEYIFGMEANKIKLYLCFGLDNIDIYKEKDGYKIYLNNEF